MLSSLCRAIACTLLAATVATSAEAQVNALAPVLKSNSKGAFKPFKAKGNAEFDVTIRLYEDSAGTIQIEDDSRVPWEETLAFSVKGKTVLPASDPAAGSYSLYIPVDGFVDLNIGAKTPLPSDLGDGFVFFTTQVTPYKKGAPQAPYLESPTKLLNAAFLDVMSIVQIPDGLGGTKKTLRIEGVNLQVVNGEGTTTGSLDGLGNLIVGYNELRGVDDNRSGSHNIVVGMQHNYTRAGGLLSGNKNTLSGDFASVSGGYSNTASGYHSSVSGGANNEAYGERASVSGGQSNSASGLRASVSGGFARTAAGNDDWVAGTLTEDY